MANNRWAIALSPHLEIQTGMRNGQEMLGEKQKILYVRPPSCAPQQPTSRVSHLPARPPARPPET